jgi:hypothetical protein
MTRRLLTSHLRHLLNPATTTNPKPFYFPTPQQNPFSQSRLLSWQFKPTRSLYFSTYKPSELPFSALSRYIVQMGRLLTRGAWLRCFSLQRQGGNRQRPVHEFWHEQEQTRFNFQKELSKYHFFPLIIGLKVLKPEFIFAWALLKSGLKLVFNYLSNS